MRLKELTIGNYVILNRPLMKEELFQINSRFFGGLSIQLIYPEIDCELDNSIKPIELSPDVLNCCQDFKMQYFDGGVIFKAESALDLKIYFYDYLDKKIRWFLNNKEIINQKYFLHQLQNLYCSLMGGKELEIDIEKLKSLYATTTKNQ